MNKIKEENLVCLHSDLMYKYIFGTNKNKKFAVELIEVILGLKSGSLKDSVIRNSVNLDKECVKSKSFEVDIILVTPDGKIINLEMQKINDTNSEIKNLMYITDLFSKQLNKGEFYSEVKETIQIVFIKENRVHKEEKLINNYTMINEINLYDKIGNGKLKVINIDVDKDRENGYNKNIKLEIWRRLIGAETREELDNITKYAYEYNYQIIKEVRKEMESFMNNEYVQDYSRQEKLIRSQMKTEREKGIITGYTNGQIEKQQEIAVKMLENNKPLEEIEMYTGLPIKKLEKLKLKIIKPKV